MPNSSGFQVNEILTAANTNTYLLRPYRNAIINGSMNVAQRSTSVAGITSYGYYTVDRWAHDVSAFGTWTNAVQSLSINDAPAADGLRSSLRITCTTANAAPASGAFNVLAQRIEGYNLQQFAKGNASAKPFALSFWVRSNITGTYIAELVDLDNLRTVSASYTITASGSWQKVRLIFPADTSGAFANANSASLVLNLWFGAGSAYTSSSLQTIWGSLNNAKRANGQVNVGATISNYFETTGVQLEPNNVCTPYEVRTFAEELTQCQRYFFRINTTPQYEPIGAAGVNQAASNHWRTTTITPVPMRRALVTADMSWSSVIAYDGSGVVGMTSGTLVGNTLNSTMVSIDWASAGGLITGRPVVVLTAPNTGFFQLSAEL